MRGVKITEEALHAFVDNELPEDEHPKILCKINRNEDIRNKISSLITLKTLIRRAYQQRN